MISNAKLDALIARLEGGEALSAEISNAVAGVVDPSIPEGSVQERSVDHDGLPIWRVRHAGQGWGSWWHGEHYAASFDAVMSLARVEKEAWRLLHNAMKYPQMTEHEPFKPEPVLRAMLIQALEMRRT